MHVMNVMNVTSMSVSVHLGVDLNAIYASFVAFWMHVGNSGAPPSMERWVEMSEMYYAWGK